MACKCCAHTQDETLGCRRKHLTEHLCSQTSSLTAVCRRCTGAYVIRVHLPQSLARYKENAEKDAKTKCPCYLSQKKGRFLAVMSSVPQLTESDHLKQAHCFFQARWKVLAA